VDRSIGGDFLPEKILTHPIDLFPHLTAPNAATKQVLVPSALSEVPWTDTGGRLAMSDSPP
jgi:hypothetical protein